MTDDGWQLTREEQGRTEVQGDPPDRPYVTTRWDLKYLDIRHQMGGNVDLKLIYLDNYGLVPQNHSAIRAQKPLEFRRAQIGISVKNYRVGRVLISGENFDAGLR